MSFLDEMNVKSESQNGFLFPGINGTISEIQKDLENQIRKQLYEKTGRTYTTMLMFSSFESVLDISSHVVKEYKEFLSSEIRGRRICYSCNLKQEAKQYGIDLEKALIAENIAFKGWGMASLFQTDNVDIFGVQSTDLYSIIDTQFYTAFWHENIPVDNAFAFYRDTKFAFFDNYILPSGKIVAATSIVMKPALKFEFTF